MPFGARKSRTTVALAWWKRSARWSSACRWAILGALQVREGTGEVAQHHAGVVLPFAAEPVGVDERELPAARSAVRSAQRVQGVRIAVDHHLLGLRGMIGGVFDGIEWSTPGVLAATLDCMRAAGVHPAMLETLSDVDTVEDLPPGWV